MYVENEHKRNKREEKLLCAAADMLAGIIKRKLIEDEIQHNPQDLHIYQERV